MPKRQISSCTVQKLDGEDIIIDIKVFSILEGGNFLFENVASYSIIMVCLTTPYVLFTFWKEGEERNHSSNQVGGFPILSFPIFETFSFARTIIEVNRVGLPMVVCEHLVD